MARKSDNTWLWILGIGAAALALSAAASTVGDQDGDGDKDIDDLVLWLNRNIPQPWLGLGLAALEAAVPRPMRFLVPLVFQVEQEFLGRKGVGRAKKQRAVALRRQRVPQPA